MIFLATIIFNCLQKHQSKKLVIDVCTRWNSTYDMLSRYIELHPSVYTALNELKMKDLLKVMNNIDIDVLEKIVAILKPFKEVTVIMSSESCSSISLIRPLIHQLLKTVKPLPDDSDEPVIHQAKAYIYHDLEKRYLNCPLLDICTYMDPRVKTAPYLTADSRAKVRDDIARELVALNEQSAASAVQSQPQSNNDACSLPSPSTSVLSSLLGDSYVLNNSLSIDESVEGELSRYSREATCPMESSPLSW